MLVRFPFTSQRSSKKRPAVVVSNLAYSSAKPDIVVMAITSQMRPSSGLGDTWVRHWREPGLLKPSAIKPVFATLEQRLVLRLLSALDPDDQAALRRAIGEVLG